MSNKKNNTGFSYITEAKELVSFLNNPDRFINIKYFTKYMKLSTLKNMFTNEMMFINNPSNMNDLYEYGAFHDKSKWEKICFASFIGQSDENMAMWSMYGQPWKDGVMISIPKKDLVKLVDNQPKLVSAEYDKVDHMYKPGNEVTSSDDMLSIVRVAYVNGKTIVYRNEENKNFSNPYSIPEFIGYLKDIAWDYEKEMRIRVDLPMSYKEKAIFLKLPQELLQQVIITTGPRFEGNMLTSLPEKYKLIEIKTSRFKEKLAWTPCDNCSYKSAAKKCNN